LEPSYIQSDKGLVSAMLAMATYTSDMNGEAPIQFSRAIDPENILTNALLNDFVHIQENVVEYYEAVEKDNRIK
jgi:hypothetical protein